MFRTAGFQSAIFVTALGVAAAPMTATPVYAAPPELPPDTRDAQPAPQQPSGAAQPTTAPPAQPQPIPPAQPQPQPTPPAQPQYQPQYQPQPTPPAQPQYQPQPTPPAQPQYQPQPQYPPPQPGGYADGYAAGYSTAPAPMTPQYTEEELRQRELRKMKRTGTSMTASGFSMLGAGYVISAIVGAIVIDTSEGTITTRPSGEIDRREQFGYRMFIPVAGPFIALPKVGTATGGVFTALLGVVQVSGLGLGIAGAVRLRKYRQNIGITMAPTPGGMSTGVRLRF